MKFDTLDARLRRYGFDENAAMNCPVGVPVWMWRVEEQEGERFRDILIQARDNGLRIKDVAEAYDLKYERVRHWAAKWNIEFPKYNPKRKAA